MSAPELSVALCAYNPPPERLDRVVRAIAAQRGAPPFEFILVDNNSSAPIPESVLAPLGARARLVRETRQGLANARSRAIAETRGALLVFVDDDNILAPDYLAECARIAANEPELGVFAGKAHGEFERKPGWLHRAHIARFAVRDLGEAPLTGPGDAWGPWEPFGAGMAVRRDVAQAFAAMNEVASGRLPLGRSGTNPASGEDSLFSRIADRLGYAVGYRPALSLGHIITAERMTLAYLMRLIEGQGRSHAILEGLASRQAREARPPRFWIFLARRFVSRLKAPGLHEAITHIWWDYGYFTERAGLDDDLHLRLRAYLASLDGDHRRSGRDAQAGPGGGAGPEAVRGRELKPR